MSMTYIYGITVKRCVKAVEKMNPRLEELDPLDGSPYYQLSWNSGNVRKVVDLWVRQDGPTGKTHIRIEKGCVRGFENGQSELADLLGEKDFWYCD